MRRPLRVSGSFVNPGPWKCSLSPGRRKNTSQHGATDAKQAGETISNCNAINFGGIAVKRSLWGWVALLHPCHRRFRIWTNRFDLAPRCVKDPSGALVPGANVTLVDKANGKTLGATANDAGFYAFAQIPRPGTPLLSRPTDSEFRARPLKLLVNQPATIDFTLTSKPAPLPSMSARIAQTLNTSDATLGDSVGNVTIEALPMEGRDPVSLLTLQPGVLYLGNPEENSTVDSRSGSVSGGGPTRATSPRRHGRQRPDRRSGLPPASSAPPSIRPKSFASPPPTARPMPAAVPVRRSPSSPRAAATISTARSMSTTVPPTPSPNQWFNKNTQINLGEPNVPQKYVMNTSAAPWAAPSRRTSFFFFFNYEGPAQGDRRCGHPDASHAAVLSGFARLSGCQRHDAVDQRCTGDRPRSDADPTYGSPDTVRRLHQLRPELQRSGLLRLCGRQEHVWHGAHGGRRHQQRRLYLRLARAFHAEHQHRQD